VKPTLLDSDTLTLLHKGHPRVNANVTAHIKQFGQLFLSEINYYEVTRGLKAIRAAAQLAHFEEFCKAHRVLPFSHEAAMIAADIWATLRRKGQLIGEMDVLIASVAIREGLAIATCNASHFSRVNGLTVVDWTV
jgi:tRNA(fMet)-specific endonuclease VapC